MKRVLIKGLLRKIVKVKGITRSGEIPREQSISTLRTAEREEKAMLMESSGKEWPPTGTVLTRGLAGENKGKSTLHSPPPSYFRQVPPIGQIQLEAWIRGT